MRTTQTFMIENGPERSTDASESRFRTVSDSVTEILLFILHTHCKSY